MQKHQQLCPGKVSPSRCLGACAGRMEEAGKCAEDVETLRSEVKRAAPDTMRSRGAEADGRDTGGQKHPTVHRKDPPNSAEEEKGPGTQSNLGGAGGS